MTVIYVDYNDDGKMEPVSTMTVTANGRVISINHQPIVEWNWRGEDGSIGIQGLTGSAGSIGSQGPVGATGPKGDTGNTGSTGSAGAAGSQGIQGVAGPTGSIGLTGPQGTQGAIGATGSTGAQGTQGSIGSTGSTGATGAAGTNGDTRIKYAKTDLVTNSSGVYSANLGAGLFTAPPVLSIVPKMASGSYDYRYGITGSSGAGYTVTITFTKRANSVTIVLGLLSLDASIGVVTFDLSAMEAT